MNAPAQSLEEYQRLSILNSSVTGSGIEGTTMHLACPFCCATDFMVYRLVDAKDAMVKGGTCHTCGRSARCEFDGDYTAIQFSIVQTGGPDQPEWLVPKMRRVPPHDVRDGVVVIGTGAGGLRELAMAADPNQSLVCPINIPVTAPPLVSSPLGKAWLVDLPAARKKAGIDPAKDAAIAHWVVEAPWAHPAWHSYSLVLVHLRPMPVPIETKFYLPGATHELWVWVINTDIDRNRLLAEGGLKGCWLSPKNFAAQIIERDDDAAAARVRRAVHMICAASCRRTPTFVTSGSICSATT